MFQESTERPLVSLVIEVRIAGLDVVRVILVDGVVAEMHTRVPQVFPGVVILDGGKPNEALLIEVDDEGVVGGDEDIESEIRLVAIDQEGVVDVLGGYHGLFQRNLKMY